MTGTSVEERVKKVEAELALVVEVWEHLRLLLGELHKGQEARLQLLKEVEKSEQTGRAIQVHLRKQFDNVEVVLKALTDKLCYLGDGCGFNIKKGLH
jgi:hypothetical protein